MPALVAEMQMILTIPVINLKNQSFHRLSKIIQMKSRDNVECVRTLYQLIDESVKRSFFEAVLA